MLFSSIPFLYWFLPAVLICYFAATLGLGKLMGKKAGLLAGNTVLLLFSLVFYGWGEPKLLFLMIFTIALFYGCGLAIGHCTAQKWKKLWLTVSVVISVALLGLFNTRISLWIRLTPSPVFPCRCCGWHCLLASASTPSSA